MRVTAETNAQGGTRSRRVLWVTTASADVQHNEWCEVTTPDCRLATDPWPGRPGDAYREYAHYLLRCRRQDLDYPASPAPSL